MKQFDYHTKEFNQRLAEYFNTDEFKDWVNAWFTDKEDN